MSVEVSVIVPSLNEEANLPELVSRVARVFERGDLRGELIIVDDGSTDGSADVLSTLSRSFSCLVVLRHPQNRGIAAAWRTGLQAARGELCAILDADLQYQPEDLLRLYRKIRESQVDLVQGWRSPIGRERGPRYFLSRGFHHLLNLLFGMRLRDNKSGFVLCPREVFADLMSYRGGYAYWQSFVMVAAHAKGYSYREVETLFEQRMAGRSFLDDIPFRVVARCLVDLGRALLEYRFGKPRREVEPGLSSPRAAAASDEDEIVEGPSQKAENPSYRGIRRLHLNAYLRSFSLTHWMMTPDVAKHLERLRRSQWYSSARLRELQEAKLRRLVRHCYRDVPYYRERMQKAGVKPEEIRTLEDLRRLPTLAKQNIRDHLYFDMMAENHDKRDMLRVTTSGSTGEPFVCYADRYQLEFRWAATLRSMEWTGYRFGDRHVRLWHQTLGMTPTQAFRERFDAWLARRIFVPAFEMNRDSLDCLVDRIERAQPILLDGYAESFHFLAQYLRERGRIAIQPRGIVSSAQTLDDGSRKVIEEAFGCRVFDKYGSREFSGIAYECEAHSGHHVVAEGYIVELLTEGRPSQPGETGEVVITDLNNHAMPLVRYRIGDLAEALPEAPCACGRGLPRIGRILGRVQSVVIGVGGRYLPGTFFSHLFKDWHHAIRQYAVHQQQPGALTLRLVKAGRFSEAALAEILALLRRYLGEAMRIEVQFAEHIELGPTGKHLAVVSSLGLDFQKISSSDFVSDFDRAAQ